MLYVWVKTIVGALLAVNFAIPLYTVVSNQELWDEPMAVLAGNMSLTCMLFGTFQVLIGGYDLVQLKIPGLCRLLQYGSFGVGNASKMAQVCMAVDRFMAVTRPLRYYQLMIRGRRWLFALTWLTWALQVTFGLFANIFDLETFAENLYGRDNGTVVFPECRWESGLAHAFTIFVEVELVTFSLVTAGLFIYTGVVGHRVKVQLMRQHCQMQHNGIVSSGDLKFFENYRAFKNIVTVLSLTVTLDIVGPIVRFTSRWYPMPKLNGLLHQVRLFGFIFEGWAYGLLNAKLRAAYKKTLCCSQLNRVDGEVVQHQQEPEVPAPPVAFVAPLELCSIEE